MVRICHQCGASVEPIDRFCASCGSAVAADAVKADPLVGRTVGGNYILQELVGVGGMGRVYRAEQSALGRTVAVKVIHPHLLGDEQTVARFYTEAKAASRLNHPNSVSIIDFGRSDDGILYLVMEFLSGKDLAMIMQEEGPLPIVRVCEILIGVLGALGEAHALGVIHRDLKPENILLKRFRSGADLVKVVDFGLATIVGGATTSITAPGLVCGTPDYMSPEQGQGDDMDGRGDLYSLGVVLFELLTDSLPFEDETPTKVVLRHINDPVPDPQKKAPQRNISDALRDITMKGLAKKPDERFQSAAELQAALETIVAEDRQKNVRRTTCASCGASNPDNMRFCGSCGARIGAAVSITPSTRTPSVRPSIYPTAPSAERLLVGRGAEVDQLDEMREAATSRIVWAHVCGESGVGKTRLLREMIERAQAAGDFVSVTRPHPTRAPVPYASTRPLLADLLDVSLEELDRLGTGDLVADPLVRAGLAEVATPKGLVGVEGPGRVGAVAAAGFMASEVARGRASARRTVLVIDDFQHCDGLTQRTIEELASTFVMRGGVFILSAGDREVIGATNIVLRGLERADAQMFLAGCSAAAGAASPAKVPAHDDRFLLPLYLEQVHALGEEGEAVPRRLADAVAGRVDRIGVKGRRVLQAASVLGDYCAIRDLRRLVGADDLSGLDKLVEHQLVRMDGERLEIVHPFIRDLVEASIPAEARRSLHAKALALVTELHGPLEVRAEHAYRAGESLTALVLLERMGDVAMQRGDGMAAVLAYRRALELGRREMLDTGDLMLQQAMVTFSRKLGEAMERRNDVASADGVLREALDLAGPASAERAKMLLVLGRVSLERDRRREAVRLLGEALEVASKLKDELVEAAVQAGIAQTRRAEGDLPGALTALRRAVQIRANTEDLPERRARALVDLGEVLLETGEVAEALLRLSEAQMLAEAADAPALRAMAVGNMGRLDEAAGRKGRAMERYRDAARLAAEAGDAMGHDRWRKLAGTLDPL